MVSPCLTRPLIGQLVIALPAELVITTDSLTPVVVGAATTLVAESTGGSGTVEYSWEITEIDGSSSQSDWSTDASLTRTFTAPWNHSSFTAGA